MEDAELKEYANILTDKIEQESFDYFIELKSYMNVDPCSFMVFVPAVFIAETSNTKKSLTDDPSMFAAWMGTAIRSRCNNIDEPGIVTNVFGIVVMTYEALYRLMIQCRLDHDTIMECMKFRIRHELGHIKALERFIGKPFEEWAQYTTECHHVPLKRLRSNASRASRIQWSIDYHFTIEDEIEANTAAGITEQDVIDDFNRMYGKDK